MNKILIDDLLIIWDVRNWSADGFTEILIATKQIAPSLKKLIAINSGKVINVNS